MAILSFFQISKTIFQYLLNQLGLILVSISVVGRIKVSEANQIFPWQRSRPAVGASRCATSLFLLMQGPVSHSILLVLFSE